MARTSKRARNLVASLPLLGAIGIAAIAAACGIDVDGNGSNFGQPDATSFLADANGIEGGPIDAPAFAFDAPSLGEGGLGTLTLSPANQTIDVTYGEAPSTITYTATQGGSAVAASFTIDRGELGTLDANTGVFTPSGTIGGSATITALYGAVKATTPVTVRLHVIQNGAPPAGDGGVSDGGDGGADGGPSDAGPIDAASSSPVNAGGVGGVGGEGLGGPVSSATLATLNGATSADAALSWLYPYDKTLWPRGVLAPLLQWRPGAASYDGVYIHIQEAAYEYKGYFAATSTPFVHHPIDPNAWNLALYSNAGEPITITLVFSSGNVAYGPITETWKVAQGTLQGTVYYNSYGTNLVHNYPGALPNNSVFGAATLAIRSGATSPVVVAGTNDLTDGCRVCHTVSADGSSLVTQHANNSLSSFYDLKTGQETLMSPADGRFAWGGLFTDGSYMFSNAASQQGGDTSLASTLYETPSGTALGASGIPSDLKAAAPVFSPDGKHVAFTWYGGTGSDGVSLAAMDYDPLSKAFSNLRKLYTPSTTTNVDGGTVYAGKVVWMSFLPTSDAIVFELETLSNGRTFGETRSTCDGSGACSNVGAQGELWWIDLATKTPARLDALNGKGYLPSMPSTQHSNDAVLNFEPTVNPIITGGYAWVVFTSRRLYGNIATINPYWSDPRYHDISVTPTPKKLWVAAIDLSAPAGTDPSSPAFYLPAQELLAGNSRGYWVVNPCLANGQSCKSGDDCCGGYCTQGDGGALVCEQESAGCSQEYDKCATNADCCGTSVLTCINQRCAMAIPK